MDQNAAASQELSILTHMPFLFNVLNSTLSKPEEINLPETQCLDHEEEMLLQMGKCGYEHGTLSKSQVKAKK